MTEKENMTERYGPPAPGDDKFTAKARLHQSIYRVHMKETMGIGPSGNASPFSNKPAFYGNIIMNGFYSGKNFILPETFEYAQKRIAEKGAGETLDRFMLFNNLLSSIAMTFNIFHPLMMIKEKYPEQIAWIIQGMFPDFDIHQIDDIRLAFVPRPIKEYLKDKTAMDAAILFSDRANRKYLISFEVKYAERLGTDEAHEKVNKYQIAAHTGLFTTAGLEQVNDCCPQIYCNFLLTEKYRMVHQLEDSFSVVLAPKDNPSTYKEITSLRKNLKSEYKYKIQYYTLEDFMDAFNQRCPYEFLDWIGKFKERYLNLKTVEIGV